MTFFELIRNSQRLEKIDSEGGADFTTESDYELDSGVIANIATADDLNGNIDDTVNIEPEGGWTFEHINEDPDAIPITRDEIDQYLEDIQGDGVDVPDVDPILD